MKKFSLYYNSRVAFIFKKLFTADMCVWRGMKLSSKQHDTFESGVMLNGKQIRVAQHYFEEMVEQPRSVLSDRREADLTGLKSRVGICNLPFCDIELQCSSP